MIERSARMLAIIVARIGDTVLATPVLRALRAAAPEGSLDVIAHPKRIAVLEGLPFIDRLVPASGMRLVLQRIRRTRRYDYAFVFGNDRPLFAHAFAVASHVVGFRQADEALNARMHVAVERPSSLEHAVLERMRLARAAGIESTNLRLEYRVSDQERSAAEQFVASLSSRRPGPLLAVAPTSFPTKAYRDWPEERFAALFERLFAAWPEAGVILIGDARARDVTRMLSETFPGRVASAAGRRSLRESAALVAGADCYVGVDTGPTHIAGALDVPMVALYHCRHRGRYLAPLQRPSLEVIEHPATDAECTVNTRMDAIDAETVWHAVARQLAVRARADQGVEGARSRQDVHDGHRGGAER